jgi:hypothetical protein
MATARTDKFDDNEPHELWDEPWEGLPPEKAPWEWDEVERERNGITKKHPGRGKWHRWYFIYHKPTCTNVKISVDQEPNGRWFNPHASSGPV